MIGDDIHQLAKILWPINRSITGDGVRKTLHILKNFHTNLEIYEIPSGKKVFDWIVPKEWNVKEAWVEGPDGKRILDFANNNLHLMGYSIPVNATFELEELDKHLFSLSNQPNAIPYVTSYYTERWGFCITHNQRKKLKPGKYKVHINSTLQSGSLTYGELIIPGESSKEIFLSTYVCHPSMANNELSCPTVTIYLAKWLESLKNRRFTYRIIFVPETIGSITYLSQHYKHLKEHVVAGFNITCVGDNRNYSYLPSRDGNTLSDQVANHILKWTDKNFKTYTWNDRGSDERQYCAPGIDLPIASIMRTKFAEYSEYHTSLDNLENVVTPEGLKGGYSALRHALEAFENNCYPEVTVLGEPHLSKRGLYHTIGTKVRDKYVGLMMNLITYSDGKTSLLTIAEKCNVPIWDLYSILNTLSAHKLVNKHDSLIMDNSIRHLNLKVSN